MKAAVFSEPGAPLTIETVPDPEPGPGDLILKVHACGICGTDLHWSDNADPTVGWRHLERGAVMGHEFSGEVVAVDKTNGVDPDNNGGTGVDREDGEPARDEEEDA